MHKSKRLGITVDLPSSYLVIHKKIDTDKLVIDGLNEAPKKVQNFLKKNANNFEQAMQKPLEVWISGNNIDNAIIIKVIATNKRLNTSSKKVINMCNSMKNIYKQKLNIDIEYCKKTKVNKYDAIHLKYPSITIKNHFTDHYMINSGSGRTIVFMTTANVNKKKKVLKEVSEILNTFKTK